MKTRIYMFLSMLFTKLQSFGAAQALLPLLIHFVKFVLLKKKNHVEKYILKVGMTCSWSK